MWSKLKYGGKNDVNNENRSRCMEQHINITITDSKLEYYRELEKNNNNYYLQFYDAMKIR